MANLTDWLNGAFHLPPFLRDFHAQKDAFKWLESVKHAEVKDGAYDIPWTKAHVYVIDTFLRTMAMCGWTLQRSRVKGIDFADAVTEIAEHRRKQGEAFAHAMNLTPKSED